MRVRFTYPPAPRLITIPFVPKRYRRRRGACAHRVSSVLMPSVVQCDDCGDLLLSPAIDDTTIDKELGLLGKRVH